jgi:hypothetical protein
VSRAVVTDFYFNCWRLEIRSDKRTAHEPRRVHNIAQQVRCVPFAVPLAMQLSSPSYVASNSKASSACNCGILCSLITNAVTFVCFPEGT